MATYIGKGDMHKDPLNTVARSVGFTRNAERNIQCMVHETNALLISCSFNKKEKKTQSALNSGFVSTSQRTARLALSFILE